MQPLQSFEHGRIVLRQQAVGNMQPIVRIDADQMGIKGGMMDLRQWDAIGHPWLPKVLVLVGDDVRGVKEQGFRQSR